jgi:hypothetical protein
MPLLVRADNRAATMRGILSLAKTAADLRVSLIGFDDFAQDLLRLIECVGDVPAYPAVFVAIEAGLPQPIEDLIAAALIVGRRRVRATTFARAVGLSLRNVELRLKNARGPTPHGLLSQALILEAAWSREILGLNSKVVAGRLGFTGPQAVATFARFVSRQTGAGLRELRRPGTFISLVQAFAAQIAAMGTSPATR